MIATLALIFGLSTLIITGVLIYVGTFDLITLAIIVVTINIAQWLLAPYLVGAIYRVREMKQDENPKLHQIVSEIARKSNIRTPKLMLSQIPLPNAFAYGSPLSGNRVAVTQGLLTTLNDGEVEAVLGHELGHLKHRDVQVMMAISFLPALCMYIGYSLMWSGGLGGNQQGKGNNGNGAVIGIAFIAFSWILNLFTLQVSRLREYYADRHSVSVVDDGANRLSTGLAKIVHATARTPKTKQQTQTKNFSGFKSLFITNPDAAQEESAALYATQNGQQLVDEILSGKVTTGDRFIEVFSTHPNIIKRLRAIQELGKHSPSTAV